MQLNMQSVFKGLADPTRRAIIELLSLQPRSIAELASEFELSRNAVVKHLKILEESGVIIGRQHGRERISHLDPARLKVAYDWLAPFETFWDNKLKDLKDIVEERQDDRTDDRENTVSQSAPGARMEVPD